MPKFRQWLNLIIVRAWPLWAALVGTALLGVAIVTGTNLVEEGWFMTVSLFGGVIMSLKVWQSLLAFRNNRRMMRIERKAQAMVIAEDHPSRGGEIRQLARQTMPFDVFRERIFGLLDLDDERWRYYARLSHVWELFLAERFGQDWPRSREELWDLYEQAGSVTEFLHKVAEVYPEWAWLEADWQRFKRRDHLKKLPKVYYVVPAYKIPELQVFEQIDSTSRQDYPGLQICRVVVNSGPHDPVHRRMYEATKAYLAGRLREQFPDIVEEYEAKNHKEFVEFPDRFPENCVLFRVVYEPEVGKRAAMHNGFDASIDVKSDITINVDGDTYLDIDATSNAVHVFTNTELAALTGDVRVSNAHYNTLTMLTALRYFYAFWVERAAQSALGQVTCLSGPFLAIRTPILAEILHDWRYQRFLGQECTYGDDRHIATLLLLRGLKVGFHPDSIVWTDAPTRLRVWRRQQLRWSKSGHRENWWLVVNKREAPLHVFIWVSLAYLSFFPILVGGVLISILVKTLIALLALKFALALSIIGPYIVIIIVANFVFNGLYGLMITGDWHFFLIPMYIGLYFGILIWLKLWALIKLKDTSWGTK